MMKKDQTDNCVKPEASAAIPRASSKALTAISKKTLKGLYNDNGIAVFTENDFHLLPDIRKKFPSGGEEFRGIENFLQKYSYIDYNTLTVGDSGEKTVSENEKDSANAKKSEKLSYDLRDFFRAMKGEPIQSFLYNAVIYNMQVENWYDNGTCVLAVIIPDIMDAIACLYLNQWRLNICIGRTAYVKEEADFEMMYCICSEMTVRFPFINSIILDAGKQIYENDSDINKLVNSYKNNDDNGKYFKAFTGKVFIEKISPHLSATNHTYFNTRMYNFQVQAERYIKRNKIVNGNKVIKRNPICSLTGFWKCISGGVPRKSGNFLIGKDGAVPTKDDLYVLVIACRFSYDTFLSLQRAAASDICDSTVYAENKYNFRDHIIQDFIRGIDTSYKMAYSESHGKDLYLVTSEDIQRDPLLPVKVLMMLDRILYNNIRHYADPEAFLLYHNYLMNKRKSEDYISAYNEWIKVKNPTKTIIDFEYAYIKDREEQGTKGKPKSKK